MDLLATLGAHLGIISPCDIRFGLGVGRHIEWSLKLRLERSKTDTSDMFPWSTMALLFSLDFSQLAPLQLRACGIHVT